MYVHLVITVIMIVARNGTLETLLNSGYGVQNATNTFFIMMIHVFWLIGETSPLV